MSPPETEEQRLASGRAALADARRVLGKRPSSPDIPAVLDPLPSLVASLRKATVPQVHAAVREWMRSLPREEREIAVALLAELPAIVRRREGVPSK